MNGSNCTNAISCSSCPIQRGDVSNESNANISTCPIDATYDQNDNHPMKATIFLIFCLLIIVINIPPLIALILTKFKSSNIRILHMLSLSVSDVIVGISLSLLAGDYLYENVSISHSACLMRLTVLAVSYYNSSNQVLIICINRLHMIVKLRPLISGGYTLLAVILTVFLTSAFLIILPCHLSHPARTEDIKNMTQCNFIVLFGNDYAKKIWIYRTSLYSLTELGILISYSILVVKLCAHQQRMRKIRPSACNMPSATQTQFRERKTIITLGLIVIVYAMCVTPMHACLALAGAGFEIPLETMNTLYGVGLFNSALNPLVYVFMMPEIKEMICGKPRNTNIIVV